jgi:hypothetical protein
MVTALEGTTGADKSGTPAGSGTELTQRRSLDVPVSYTYFVQAGTAVKIGTAQDYRTRIKTLQIGQEKPLIILAIVLGSIADEYQTHQRFAHLRMRGEWFRLAPDLVEFINGLAPHNLHDRPVIDRVPEIRRHLRMLQATSPVLRHHLSTLDDMLKSWDAGGNRLHLAGNIERTIRAIENLRQPAA